MCGLTRRLAAADGEQSLGHDRGLAIHSGGPPTLSVRISTMPADFAAMFWSRGSEMDGGRRSGIELEAISPVELDGENLGS